MFKDFSKFNFTVIDVTTAATPEMTINLNGITFNQRTQEALDNPEYVRPLIDAENMAFAIQVCSKEEKRAMKFTKTNGKGGYSSTCNTIRAIIRRVMGDKWNDGMRYSMEGTIFSDQKAIVFDLAAAKELPPFRYPKHVKK